MKWAAALAGMSGRRLQIRRESGYRLLAPMGMLRRIPATASMLLALALSCSSKKRTSFVPIGDGTCANSLDCRGQPNARTVCDTENGQCVQCVGTNDCTEDNACYGHVCRRPCTSDNNCALLQLLCNQSVGLCVSCLRDEECSAGTFCEEGSCTANATRRCDPSDCSRCVSCFDLCTCNGGAGTECAQACLPQPTPGCSTAPDCGSCPGCFESCVCQTGSPDACVTPCSTLGAGGSGGTSAAGGTGGV